MNLVFSTSIYGPGGKHEGHELRWKIQDALTYRTDRENEVSKMFIISLGNWIELESTPQSQAVCTLEHGPWSMDTFTALCVVDQRISQTLEKSRKSYLNLIGLSEMLQLTRVIETSSRATLCDPIWTVFFFCFQRGRKWSGWISSAISHYFKFSFTCTRKTGWARCDWIQRYWGTFLMKSFWYLEERVITRVTHRYVQYIMPVFLAGRRAFSALRLLELCLVSINTLDVWVVMTMWFSSRETFKTITACGPASVAGLKQYFG